MSTRADRDIAALEFALALVVVFVGYELVAFVNSFVLDLKGAGMDAEKFQTLAAQWARQPRYEFSISVGFYVQLIGTVFLIAGENEYLASQISVVALVLAARKLHHFLASQGLHRNSLLVLLVVFWPSLVPRGGTTLREPLILLATIYLVAEVVAYLERPSARTATKVLLSAAAMFIVHKATGVMALGILGLVGARVLLQSRMSAGARAGFIVLAVAVSAAILGLAARFADLKDMQVLVTLLQGDVEGISSVLEYKYGVEARAAYDAPIDLSNPLSFAWTVARAFLYYMFQPFPTRISSAYDAYAFAEVVVRSGLLWVIARRWNSLAGPLRMAFLSYLLISLVWSVGTTNYGTASRHHLTNYWLLIVLASIASHRAKQALDRPASAARRRDPLHEQRSPA